MKHFKKFLGIICVLILCLAPVLANPISAHAEGSAVTYYVKYVPSLNEFRYQLGTWQDGQEHWAIATLKQNIKDGDLLVIEDTHNAGIKLEVDVRLSNLTVVSGNWVVVVAKSIDDFYIINDSTASVTGNVTNAYVYDKSVANFNSNVKNLIITSNQYDLLYATAAVVGTCDYLQAGGKSYKHYEFYNFAANTLRIENGHLTTKAANYSTTPAAPTTPPAPEGEYDDVPKTGVAEFNPLWLFLLSAVCFAGSYGIRKIK